MLFCCDNLHYHISNYTKERETKTCLERLSVRQILQALINALRAPTFPRAEGRGVLPSSRVYQRTRFRRSGHCRLASCISNKLLGVPMFLLLSSKMEDEPSATESKSRSLGNRISDRRVLPRYPGQHRLLSHRTRWPNTDTCAGGRGDTADRVVGTAPTVTQASTWSLASVCPELRCSVGRGALSHSSESLCRLRPRAGSLVRGVVWGDGTVKQEVRERQTTDDYHC